MRIAYLNTEYPSLSHTFIEREVRALRARGVEVHTFSVRRPPGARSVGRTHSSALAETTYLLDGWRGLLSAQGALGLTSPLSYARGLWAAQRQALPGLRSRALHLAYLAEAVKLARELERQGLRHVHVHMANNGAMVALLATRLDPRLSYSLTVHGSAEFYHVDTWRLAAKAEHARFVRCISSFCRAQVMAWTRAESWPRFHVVHCGIDPEQFTPRPPPTQGPLRILTVGRLHPIKGYPLLLEACAELSRRGVDWSLDVVGDGPLRPALERLALDLGLGSRVVFSGAVSQEAIGRHFDAADLLCVSSFMEGVPVVMMEAMAKELAVVATEVGGIPELVEDGVSGLLVRTGSVPALADALARLAGDRAERIRLGQRGRERVLAEFTTEHVAGPLVRLFEQWGTD